MPDSPAITSRRARLSRRLRGDTVRELFWFGLIGGTGAVLYTALNVAFTRAGIFPSLSIALTLLLLIPPVYYFQHRMTFRSGRNHRVAFPRYVGTQLFGNVLAMIATAIFRAPIEAHPIPAWILIAALVAAVNFGILKFWVFHHRSPIGTSAGCPTSI